MRLSLRYGDLSRAANHANKLASELNDYCDSLSKKVQNKIYNVEGGMSSALNTADYYVNQKIRNLRTKASNAGNLSRKISSLHETAKRVDSEVKSTIEANQKNLFQKHADLRPSKAQLYLTSFLCDAKNIPIIGGLIRGGEALGDGLDKLKREIRYWYKCEGGKEFVGLVLSAAAAVLAIVVAVAAFVFTGGGLFAIIAYFAGIVGAIIGVLNASANLATSIQAYESALGGHPGQAKIYAEMDKLSDVLRDTNFHDKEKNRASNAFAAGLDLTEAVCDIVGIVEGTAKAVKALKKVNIKKVFNAICRPRNAKGQFIPGGKPSFWNGMKCITTKINTKSMLLGDLNVKNLSRLSKLDLDDSLGAVKDLAKAANGIVSDFDKMNEGNMTFKEFIAKRILIGLDNSMFKEQKLTTEWDKEKGYEIRKYRNTNLTKIFNGIRLPVDNLGLGKILVDWTKNDTLSNVISPKGGLIEGIQDIAKAIDKPSIPEIKVDNKFRSDNTKSWNRAQSRFNMPAIRGNAVLNMRQATSRPSYIVPAVKFNVSTQFRYPYFNIEYGANT